MNVGTLKRHYSFDPFIPILIYRWVVSPHVQYRVMSVTHFIGEANISLNNVYMVSNTNVPYELDKFSTAILPI